MQSTSELDVLLKILSAPEGYDTKNIQHRQALCCSWLDKT